MADLTKFVNPALKQGETYDVYLNRFPQIGSGNVKALQPLQADLYVDAKILGNAIKGDILIRMPDLAPSGTCKISFLGGPLQDAPYTSKDGKLSIKALGRTVSLSGGDKQWSWIEVSGIPASIGIWPTSHALQEEDEMDLAGADTDA